MNYYKLLDKKRNGTIVRTKGRDQQEYIPGRGWIDSYVILEYFNDKSPLYELYEEITEAEARILTGGDVS